MSSKMVKNGGVLIIVFIVKQSLCCDGIFYIIWNLYMQVYTLIKMVKLQKIY